MTIQYVRDQGGAGISVGTASYTDRPNLPKTNLSLRNVGTASGSITLTSFNGSVAEPITIPPGGPFAIRDVSLLEYTLKGNGSQWIIYGAYPDFVDPQFISAVIPGTISAVQSGPWTTGRNWTLGSGDTPGRSWALSTTDTPTVYGNAGKPFNQDGVYNMQATPVISGTGTGIYGKVQTYDTNNNPIASAVGSGNTPIKQDSAGNLQHVPVLQGTTTPIASQAQQYDANNYPLHTQGNVTSNGGDSAAPTTSGTISITAAGTYTATFSVPSGKKWLLSGIGVRLSSTSTGGFAGTVTNINVKIQGFGSPFASEGPQLQTATFSWDILLTQTGEAWFYDTSQYPGLTSSATFSTITSAFSRDYLYPYAYAFVVEIVVSSVSANGNATVSFLPIGLQEPI